MYGTSTNLFLVGDFCHNSRMWVLAIDIIAHKARPEISKNLAASSTYVGTNELDGRRLRTAEVVATEHPKRASKRASEVWLIEYKCRRMPGTSVGLMSPSAGDRLVVYLVGGD